MRTPPSPSPATLRTLAAEYVVPVRVLMDYLELVPAHHDPDAPLTSRVEAFYRLVLNAHADAAARQVGGTP